MEKKLEIKKLIDIVVWADNLITLVGFNEERYKSDASTAYTPVKAHELWKIKDVVLEAINRHNTYTNALNKDIADKAAKIELLEKEIEGRKEGYTALKELMDTKYIPIEEHDNVCKAYEKKVAELEKESEKWQDLAKMNRDTICNQYDVCEDFKKKIAELEEKVKHQRANLDGINKTLDIRTKENESLIQVRNNQTREIEAHEAENERLSDIIKNLRASNEQLKYDNSYLKKASKNKNDVIRKAYVRYVDEACKGREEIMNECYEKLTKDDTGYQGFKQYTLRALETKKDEKEAKKILSDTIDIIFYNKKAEEKRKEETKKELNEAFGVPCGEDSIE